PRLLGELPKRSATFIDRLAECGESPEKTRGPFDVTAADGEGEVAEFYSEEAAHFAHIFDSPAGRRRTELCIACVDVCALLNKEFDDGAVSAECSKMKRCCAGVVFVVDEFGMSGDDCADLFQCALP